MIVIRTDETTVNFLFAFHQINLTLPDLDRQAVMSVQQCSQWALIHVSQALRMNQSIKNIFKMNLLSFYLLLYLTMFGGSFIENQPDSQCSGNNLNI